MLTFIQWFPWLHSLIRQHTEEIKTLGCLVCTSTGTCTSAFADPVQAVPYSTDGCDRLKMNTFRCRGFIFRPEFSPSRLFLSPNPVSGCSVLQNLTPLLAVCYYLPPYSSLTWCTELAVQKKALPTPLFFFCFPTEGRLATVCCRSVLDAACFRRCGLKSEGWSTAKGLRSQFQVLTKHRLLPESGGDHTIEKRPYLSNISATAFSFIQLLQQAQQSRAGQARLERTRAKDLPP